MHHCGMMGCANGVKKEYMQCWRPADTETAMEKIQKMVKNEP